MKTAACLLSAGVLLFAPPHAVANVRLPAIFSDHMVLQADRPLPFWGWADAGEAVRVSCGDRTVETVAGADGRWRLDLPARPSSAEPVSITVAGKNTLTLQDVLVGEVWLCSGQSNMAMTVSRSRDFDKEKPAATFPAIRMFFVQSSQNQEPQDDCKGVWKVCSPETVGEFSATGYFFGRDVHLARKQPVGLINSSVGGTPVEAWTSWSAQKDLPELATLFATWKTDIALHSAPESVRKREAALEAWREAVKAAKAAGKPAPRAPEGPGRDANHKNRPSGLFNGKIAPLIPYALRGAIWYQGESNAQTVESSQLYDLQLRTLITDWRTRWGQGDFPFAWVQLPNYRSAPTVPCPESDTWPVLRESMQKALRAPATGMTVNLDIGMAEDIHPVNKQDIGRRLALWARAHVYGEKLAWSGPVFDQVSFAGANATISFQHGEGLTTTDGAAPKGFVVAGDDKVWTTANARLENGRVMLVHPTGAVVRAVRYAWANNPPVNLTNATGLPAAPFRTDNWPLPSPASAKPAIPKKP